MTIHGPSEATESSAAAARRDRCARRGFWPGRAAWALLALVSAVVGCSDDQTGGRLVQPCATQVITGRILTPDDPRTWVVSLLGGSYPSPFRVTSHTDSTGAFSVTAPTGRYILGVSGQNATVYYAASGPTNAIGRADTLLLASGRPVGPIELRAGSCEIRVRTPAALEGVYVRLRLWRRDSAWEETVSATATRTGGWLVVRYAPMVPGVYVAGTDVFSDDWRPFPFGSTLETAQRFVIEAGRRTEAEFELPAPAVLRGSVDGSWQRLRELTQTQDAVVQAYRPDSTQGEFVRLRDSRSWSFASYETTPRRLVLWIGGIARWIGGPSFQDAAVFTPVLGETLTVPEEIESGILVRTVGPDSLLDSRAAVELFDSLGVSLGRVSGGYGAYSSNRFVLANLVPGSYYLKLSHASSSARSAWSNCWHEGAKDQAHAAAVRIHRRGEIVVLETRLPPAARILGRVQTSRPEGYQYLLADLWNEGDTSHAAYQQTVMPATDPFEFSGMEMGRYLLSVAIDTGGHNYSRWWYPGTWSPHEAQVIDIHDFGQVEDLAWSLPQ